LNTRALFDIRKFQKNLGIFVDLFVGLLALCFIFFFVYCFFPYFLLNLWTFTTKRKSIVQRFFVFPSKKEQIIKKGKQKENGIEKVFLLC
jgi:hypothetical protein